MDNGSKELEFDNENRKNSSYTLNFSLGSVSFVLKNKKIVKDIKYESYIVEKKSGISDMVDIIYDSKGKKKNQQKFSFILYKE